MSDILKSRSDEQLWELAYTKIAYFHCYPESVEEILESQKKVYLEEGYEILDIFIEGGYRMCKIALLIKHLNTTIC